MAAKRRKTGAARPSPELDRRAERTARQAAALRANLRRRKDQARARADDPAGRRG